MKRVACCLDGTWNNDDDGSIVTNVVKLHRCVAPVDANGIVQKAHYVTGIDAEKGLKSKFLKGALGLGVGHRIKSGFAFLTKTFEPGDEIYLFGFSRGAFEARSLAGFITLFGIAKRGVDQPNEPAWIEQAWALYQQAPAKRDAAVLERLRAAAHFPVRIKCVGVWDTVANIGNSLFSDHLSKLAGFHDIQLHPTIDVALHALSIDEVRGPFRPSMWTLAEGQELPPGQHVEQVWFAGVHADVGGGFEGTALSDVALDWMMKRTHETAGLEFNPSQLDSWTRARVSRTTKVKLAEVPDNPAMRPNPLGAQHTSAADPIFGWSNLFPYIRLIRQNEGAIPAWRSRLIGFWRSGKLPDGVVAVNESIHESVGERYGQPVVELAGDRPNITTYQPGNLAALIPTQWSPPKQDGGQAAAAPGEKRRVKIFTVHGTFAHETDWISWDDNDPFTARAFPDETAIHPVVQPHPPAKVADIGAAALAGVAGVAAAAAVTAVAGTPAAAKPKAFKHQPRNFVNQLSEELWKRDVILSPADHTEYNWSGGNSHDERRVGAIGLKHTIEHELERAEKNHIHYDGVYVIGHSHGGTISRLAMNFWDKDFYSYTPLLSASKKHDAFKLEDDCPHCFQKRNGRWSASRRTKPDAVITFGSPFVTFEKRNAGLLTAQIAVWVFRFLSLIPLIAVMIFLALNPPSELINKIEKFDRPIAETIFVLAWPVAAFWLLIVYVPRHILNWLASGKNGFKTPVYAAASFVSILITVFGLFELVRYAGHYMTHFGSILGPLADKKDTMSFIRDYTYLGRPWVQNYAGWSVPFVLYWLLAVHLPSRFLNTVKREVVKLKDNLPKKYDPREDQPVRYLSYTTPLDEAGLGLRTMGFLTFLVQTLSLSAACIIAFGIATFFYVGIEAIYFAETNHSLLSILGVSAWEAGNDNILRKNFIAFYNYLTFIPTTVWSPVAALIGVTSDLEKVVRLSPGVDTDIAAVGWMPLAVLGSAVAMAAVTITMAIPLLVIAYYLVGYLRKSMIFGSEHYTWTMANRIAVTNRPNSDTMLRTVALAHQAWPRMEYAHCYYYKSPQVIEEVADYITGALKHEADNSWQLGTWVAKWARWFVVALFVLSTFMLAVPYARYLDTHYSNHTEIFDSTIRSVNTRLGKDRPQRPPVQEHKEPAPAPESR